MIRTTLALGCMMALPLAAQADSHVSGDPAAGERGFRKCAACHEIGPGAQNKVGPMLNGIVGRTAGSADGFAYSATLAQMNADGKVWTPDEIAAFLAKPRDYAPGTKMAFAGLRKEEERNDIIAYLANFGADGM